MHWVVGARQTKISFIIGIAEHYESLKTELDRHGSVPVCLAAGPHTAVDQSLFQCVTCELDAVFEL